MSAREPGTGLRRRLRREGAGSAGLSDSAAESLAAMHAELVLLREENARLRGAEHRRADIGRLLGRARSLQAPVDRDNLGDDVAQLLVDGLVIRESLLEICEELGRSLVAFEARLHALGAPVLDSADEGEDAFLPPDLLDSLPAPHAAVAANGNGSNGNGNGNGGNGHGPAGI